MAVLLCLGRLPPSYDSINNSHAVSSLCHSHLLFWVNAYFLIQTRFSEISSAFSLDWRSSWIWFATELPNSPSFPTASYICQVSPKRKCTNWNWSGGLCEPSIDSHLATPNWSNHLATSSLSYNLQISTVLIALLVALFF